MSINPIPIQFPAITRRTLLRGAAALAASTVLPGCGSKGGSTTSTTPPATNSQPIPAGSIVPLPLTVTATSAGSISPAFAGLSYEKSSLTERLFTSSNTNLIGLFQRLGPSVLRVGGNSVDKNVWTPAGPGQISGQIAPGDVASLAAFVKAAGWQCLYGINLGGAATGANTPALAASEVEYAYQQFGSSLLGVEIGNECDLYGNAGNYYAGAWSYSDFLALWGQYRTAILATTPKVSMTGPADASNVSSWTIPFGQTVTKSEITLLTQHYYRANGQSPTSTVQLLITPDPTLVSEVATLQAGAKGIGIPWRMAECNSFYNGGAPGVTDSYASSLWVVDFLFDCALGGAIGVNFHGGGNGTGYTPIADSNGTVVQARPEYYGMLLFTLAGQGTLYTTQLSTGGLNATAYAVKTATGLNLILVNKDSTDNVQVTIQLPTAIASATLLEMTQLSAGASAPNLSATDGVTIQGASVGINGSFAPPVGYTLDPSGTQLTCYVPSLSAVLIQTT